MLLLTINSRTWVLQSASEILKLIRISISIGNSILVCGKASMISMDSECGPSITVKMNIQQNTNQDTTGVPIVNGVNLCGSINTETSLIFENLELSSS